MANKLLVIKYKDTTKEENRVMRTKALIFVGLFLAVCIWCSTGAFATGQSLNAPDTNSVLILSNSVVGGTDSWEAVEARANGFTAVVVTSNQWVSMTTSNFATYRAIVLGDGECAESSSMYGAAAANTSTWHAAISGGNIILMGSDPSYHATNGSNAPGAQALIMDGIAFAGAVTNKTGFYFAFGCNTGCKTTKILDALSPGGFSLTNANWDYCHIVETAPALASLTDNDLSLWDKSVRSEFTSYPVDFTAFALAASTSFTSNPPPTGLAYILVQGAGVEPTLGCTPADLDRLVQDTSLLKSQKKALINAINQIQYLACLIPFRPGIKLEKAFDKRVQKFVRQGRLDAITSEQLITCIDELFASCTYAMDSQQKH